MAWGMPRDPFAPPAYFSEEEAPFGGGILAPVVKQAGPLAAARRPGFFGQGGTGRSIAGVIGDALLQMSGGQPMYAPLMARRSLMHDQQQAEESQYQRHRGDENADWMARQEWERAHPAPHGPGAFAQRVADMRSLGATDEQISRLIENETLGTPVAVDSVDAAGNTVRQYVRPGTMRPATTAPPPPPVGTVRGGYRFNGGNPADPSAWAPIEGGPTRTGSGTFR